MGLDSTWAITPAIVALFALIMISLVGAGPSHLPVLVDGSRRFGSALIMGLWLSLAPLAGQGDAKSEHRFEWIVDTVWEPRTGMAAKLPDPVKTLPRLERGRPENPSMLRHLARHLAATGENVRALELLSQALIIETQAQERQNHE